MDHPQKVGSSPWPLTCPQQARKILAVSHYEVRDMSGIWQRMRGESKEHIPLTLPILILRGQWRIRILFAVRTDLVLCVHQPIIVTVLVGRIG